MWKKKTILKILKKSARGHVSVQKENGDSVVGEVAIVKGGSWGDRLPGRIHAKQFLGEKYEKNLRDCGRGHRGGGL